MKKTQNQFTKANLMNRLISICIMVFLTVMCNAQEKNKSKYSGLNQDQLNLALTKSINTIRVGKTLTFVGLGVMLTATTILMVEGFKAIEGEGNSKTAETAAYVLFSSGFLVYAGIPVWIVGANKKKNIQLELAKFKTPGTGSIYGVGVKINF